MTYARIGCVVGSLFFTREKCNSEFSLFSGPRGGDKAQGQGLMVSKNKVCILELVKLMMKETK